MGRGKFEDLKGMWFGRIKVLSRAPKERDGQSRWVCRCHCGKIFVAQSRYLKSGQVKSCGCSQKRVVTNDMGEYDMRKNSQSLDALELYFDIGDPYQNLANAIVAVAADDFRTALKQNNNKLKTSLEEFFHSNWYKSLTGVDADNLICLLQKEH